MGRYDNLIEINNTRWETAVFHGDKLHVAQSVARRLVAPRAKSVYQALERDTGVPWWVIAVIHERESSQKWDRSIAQGDPWDRVSVNVPAGRGPFRSFHEAAVDALKNCHPYAARWTDWSPGGALTLLELYNGLSYSKGPTDINGRKWPPQASPYIWSGSDKYTTGKFYADHKYRHDIVDQQLGCATLVKAMMELDPSIGFSKVDEPPPVEDDTYTPPPEPPAPSTQPSPKAQEVPAPVSLPPQVTPDEKSIWKSKITWAQGAILTFFGINTGSDVDFSSLSTLFSIVKSPGFMLVALIACVGATVYWRWKDHGRGSTP